MAWEKAGRPAKGALTVPVGNAYSKGSGQKTIACVTYLNTSWTNPGRLESRGATR